MRGVALARLRDAGIAAEHNRLLAPGVVAVAVDDGAGLVGDGDDRALLVAMEIARLTRCGAVEGQHFANGTTTAI